MKDCIFCKIIKGDIPSYKIYEDENVLAILDISKDAYGHTLVLSKKHYKNLLEIPTLELNKVIETVQEISKHYINNCGFEGINIINNNEPCAGQSVMHLHIHIIPRKENDELKLLYENKSLDLNLEAIAQELKIK